ncbi:hypothetical protein COAQ111491_09100 [Comamonas aquatilis]|uniref:hypothetical protein n=1 Tax=Comamonas TaxID=283 RepID=UPI000EB213EB|nr:hypothetical protein [Comamonas sp. lk]
MDHNSPPTPVVSVIWFRETEFEAMKRLMVDGKTAFGSYEEWLQSARLGEQHQRRAGHKLIRATIHPKEFKSWCQSRNLSFDANSRKLFADWYAQEELLSTRT